MKIMFLKSLYEGKVELCKDTLDYLKKKKYSKVGLFASVQFVNNLDWIKKQLEENNIQMVISKPARAHKEGQLLGCNVYEDSLNLTEKVECYLYIGDGRFHPLALVYAQKDKNNLKEVICNDPINEKMSLLSLNDIGKILKKQKGSLMKFLNSDNIGVLITIKPGQEHLKASLKLERKYPNKKFYYFIDNNISFNQLENFNFIDVWVNTACPRIGLDEQEKFLMGVVNLSDVLDIEEALAKIDY
ncbi:MAG: diphthamide synthesis protein [Nanoarchaeota archaeon]|nr:2-(3-amino-3-carboxypropyl)histidine synthase subunit [Nanoarchaeota archaeon]MBU1632587.1 2-(3-amino-3-carboxypropyl)histidine synthase subunit [Nanoarchaeota archaeon]MBU1876517.1 2-(3-amino-3-carboxypropyl)histidine synthase subunit [Nanoarchaeota archaeon]